MDAIRADGAQVSMEQLARAGGVTKPILYRHFGDRDGLVRAIGDRYADALVAEVVGSLTATEPRLILSETIGAYLAFLEADSELYRFLTTHVRVDSDSGSALIDSVARQVARTIGDQLRSQGLDAGGSEPFAFGIVGMVHQAGDWWLRTGTMSREALAAYLTDLLWAGFAGMAAVPVPAPGEQH